MKQDTLMTITANGNLIDMDDYFLVDAVKWETNTDKYFAGLSTHVLSIRYDKNIHLKLLEIEKGYSHEHLNSIWIDTSIFHKQPFYNWETNKFKQNLIRAKVIELLKEANLHSLQKESVVSGALKYIFYNKAEKRTGSTRE